LQVDDNGLEVLDRAQCLSLLSTVPVGRVGVSIRALPVVLPVNFVVVDEQVMFRTGAGTKLRAASDGAVVAFEADAYDEATRLGWSVLIQGVARVIDGAGGTGPGLEHLGAWGNGNVDDVVVVAATMITGRRILGG
jgi:nitroimidazol reductase NimA-like FMN-containing flavoprotein (pyridoxamine 5'-phosphate oxidase superfamily)